MSDECSSEWERRKQFIRNGFPMPHCGGKRYTMPDDIAEELKVRAAIEQVEGTVFERAADEIERLREALRIESEELTACAIDRNETQRERDEARREVCEWVAMMTKRKPSTAAKDRGWDCFKENTHEH